MEDSDGGGRLQYCIRQGKQNSLENVSSEQTQELVLQTSWEEPSSRHLPGRGISYSNQ